MLLGIFAPYDIVNEEFIETLETIVSLSKVTLFNKKEKAAENRGAEQIQLSEEVDE